MQNKGAIQLFAVLLTLVSLYQLSFTWVTNSVRSDAEEYAQGDAKKEAVYLDSIAGKTVYNFLGLRKFTYKECQNRELNLGLDLKGGMNVTLEVSVVDLIRALSDYSTDETFVKAIELAQQRQKSSQQDFVTLFGNAFEEINPDAQLASVFMTLDLKDRINFNSTNEDVLKIIREETESAIDNSFNILRSRIDRFGVAQPNIQQLETSGRILVELPGIKEPERVRKLLQGTANLQFWETYDNTELFQNLEEANAKLKQIKEVESEVEDTTSLLDDETETALADSTDESSLLDNLDEVKDSTEINEANTMEDFTRENPLFGILRPSTNRNGELMRGAAVGVSHWKDTAQVRKYLNMQEIRQLFPRDVRFLWEVKAIDAKDAGNLFRLIAIRVTSRDGQPALDGDVITNARAEFGQNQASAEVTMSMNGEGSKIWARLTKDNIGKQIAIVLDNYVYSFPVVNNEITGGNSSISGDFTIAEAQDLANILKSGKLPAPAHIIEEEIVGPSLGQEAIDSGLISFIIAFVVVLLYMIFYYNKAGLAANVALIANIFFIFGVLASIGAVLTLPGIAGIVLTIGISVDANVLIYERIREELAGGKGLRLAIKDGYNNAYSAIIDANVTTFITGIILYYFGTGSIKGFATTLVIGILTSLFAAIFLTRLIFIWQLNREKNITFATKLTDNAFKNTNIDFIGKRKIMYVISGIIIIAGLASLVIRGLNLGVDFKGGRTYVVRFDETVNTVDVANALAVTFGDAPEVKVYGENNQVKVTTDYLIEEDNAEADEQVEAALFEGVKGQFGVDVDKDTFLNEYRMSSQKVGPTIADDIKVQALEAIIIALIFMFLYIFIRFKGWQYGLGAVAALTHDVLIILGLFSLLYSIMPFSLEIDQAFIAAILTVVGYSLNDTVVVFDRIREYFTLHKKRERIDLMNMALNSTLSRTFSTSLSTFVVLLTIFIFGGEVIRGFIFSLLVGVIVGTYSSLFVATPIAYDTMKKVEKTVEKRDKRKKAPKKKANEDNK